MNNAYDKLVLKRLRKVQSLLPHTEIVTGERRVLEQIPKGQAPHKDWEVLCLPENGWCQRPPPDWQPVVPSTMTQMANGTWAYVFYAGPYT